MKKWEISEFDNPCEDVAILVGNRTKFLKINYSCNYMVFLSEDEIKSWMEDYGMEEEEINRILKLKIGESYDPTGCECFIRISI